MLSQAVFPPKADLLFSSIDLTGRSCLVVAVSGGGDSLALLLLLHDHLRRLADAPSLLAVTVDHGLRAQAAEEARAVERLCWARGIAHRTLQWQGEKPASGLSAAAREARLGLLAKAAEEAGSDLVLTGHTADDQAETLAMRGRRGSGRGMAGMAPATLHEGRIWFVRPLLGVRRAALRGFLQAQGVGWFDDPTNEDRRFERARVRQALAHADIEPLLATGRRMAAARALAGEEAATFIARHARLAAPGLLRLAGAATRAEGETALYALRILLAVAGGTSHLPDEARSRALQARLEEDGLRVTLSRAVVAVRRGAVYLHREGRHLPRLDVAADLVWDGRYRVAECRQAEALTLAASGRENVPPPESGEEAPRGLARAAAAAEPAFWKGGLYLGRAVPGVVLQPVAGPWARFLPCFDLAAARAVLRLIGGVPPPPSPWRGHNDDDR